MYKYVSVLLIWICITFSLKAQEKQKLEWLFIYYMPYDNNLSVYTDTIINMLSEGLINDDIMVVIQTDFADSLGMKRYVLSNDTITQSNISTENSASPQTFDEYLIWVNNNFNSKNYCLVFLDHGGSLDELCLDEYPEQNYLKIDHINKSILNFNKRINKKIELLFMQVCAKGSIEPIYEIKNCSNYTLFSQLALGAPNYYYEKMLKYVGENPEVRGNDIAEQIVLNEKYDMYNSYVCIENMKLDSLKIHFNNFLKSFSPTDKIIYNDSNIMKFYYGWDCYWDLKSFLNSLVLDKTSTNKKEALLNYLTSELIVFNKPNPKIPEMKKYCGISLFAFTNKNYSSYKHLQIYKDFILYELKSKISINTK